VTLRTKTALTVVIIMGLLTAAVLVISEFILKQRGLALEAEIVHNNVGLAQNALYDDLEQIDKFAMDWANWDDTYEFLTTRTPRYVESNLSHSELLTQQLSFMVFVDAARSIIFSTGLSLDYESEEPVLASLLEYIKASKTLSTHSSNAHAIKGFVALPECYALIVSRPVLTSAYQGPAAGSLIVGRYLSPAKMDVLSKQTRLALSIAGAHTAHASSSFADALRAHPDPAFILVKALNATQVNGYALMRDIHQEPCFVLSVQCPRTIYQQYIQGQRYFMAAIVAVFLCAAPLVFVFFDRHIIARLSKLSAFLQGIRSTEMLSDRVVLAGTDEIGSIGLKINTMLDWLQRDLAKRREAEQQRLLSEKQLALAADNFPGLVFIIDRDFRLKFANNGFTKVSHLPVAQIIGKPLCEIIGQNNYANAEPRLKLAFQGQQISYESTSRLASGRIVHSFNTFVPDIDAQGTVTQLFAFGVDITARKQAEEGMGSTRSAWRPCWR